MKNYKERPLLNEEAHIKPGLTECCFVSMVPPVSGSEEWHELRRAGIGSSDAPSILGLSPWSSTIDIWKEKLGLKDPDPGNAYTWFGTWFESHILHKISYLENKEIEFGCNYGLLSWNFWPIATANIDGYNLTDDVIEEIKTTSEPWKDAPPTNYYIQVQHQLMVTGCPRARIRQFICPIDRAHVARLLERLIPRYAPDAAFDEREELDMLIADWLFDIGQLVTWDIERDEDVIEKLYEKEVLFWQHVEDGIEPSDGFDNFLDTTVEIENEEIQGEFEKLVEIKKKRAPLAKLDTEEKTIKEKLKQLISIQAAVIHPKPKRLSYGGHIATFTEKGNSSYITLRPLAN